jgi:hypothetical protein
MYSSNKKPQIDPMNMDFDSMIRNHPEFFTKLSSQNFEHPPLSPPPRRPPPASGGLSRLPPLSGGFSSKLSSVPDDYPEINFKTPVLPGAFLDLTPKSGKSWQFGGGRRVGGPGATLKPKIYPPTLMRNPKPKRGRNNFFK